MLKTYTSPGGTVYNVGLELAKATHLLIAGSSGSGKSVAVRLLVDTILTAHTPANACFVFCDPKRIDLHPYTRLPRDWWLDYASSAEDIARALEHVVAIMEDRYTRLIGTGTYQSNERHIYVIIEEYADLTLDRGHRKRIEPLVVKLLQLGRAANIHVLIVTQRPTADVITGRIKTNADYRLALHTATSQDSRNIITRNGAEHLHHGEGLYYTPNGIFSAEIPFLSFEDVQRHIDYWNTPEAIQVVEQPDQRKATQTTAPRRSWWRRLGKAQTA